MRFFDKIWKSLTDKQAKLPASEPLVAEQINRGEADRQGYFKWLQSGRGKNLADEVFRSYRLKQQKEEGELQVHLLKMPYANGFAVTYHPSVTATDFKYFFDWLKDRVVGMGSYRLVNAERKIFDRGKYVEEKEKYYLKPIIEAKEPPFDQQYGNILVELVLVDNNPSFLKFVATVYSDRLYIDASPFDELLDALF